MTNHWSDMINSDVVMIMGGNPAENHPISMNWLRRTKEQGTVLIHVDPRFNRSSQICDEYAKLRSGTDIAFVGGMIRYALENDRIHLDYIRDYTNASWIVREGFGLEEGLFTGFDARTKKYDKSSWAFELDAEGFAIKDETLEHPRSVFQLLKKHFSRYDADTVISITGTPRDIYLRVCEIFTSTGGPGRSGTWLYAMGTAQHSHGTQNIRSYAILQLLLGNVGIAGGGINAMRGEANVQGSTDHGLLSDSLPGYLQIPSEQDADFADYLDRVTPKALDRGATNWWSNKPKYVTSLLKAWWGEHASAENDFDFDYLPKVGPGFKGEGHTYIPLFQAMRGGQIKGLFTFGQNPAVGGPNSNFTREALDQLEWMVVVDLFEHETATHWMRPGVDPKTNDTEVFILPAAASVEKEGSITNSGRWMQWRYAAVEPVGESLPDLDIVDKLFRAVRDAYANSEDGVFPDPITNAQWDYRGGHGEAPDPHVVAREINGRFLEKDENQPGERAGRQVDAFTELSDDGSTACGNWIYSGHYTEKGNQAARRDATDAENGIGLHPNWAWVWPANRRILYNLASVDSKGRPFDPKRWVVRWNEAESRWDGDVPDGSLPPGSKPFIMLPGGVAQLYAPNLEDGPLPEHYEPVESPIPNQLSKQQYGPATRIWNDGPHNKLGTPEEFPIVGTTYRVSEHWQTGAMSRNMPWLAGLVPDAFVEIGVDLARERGIERGDRVIVSSARGEIEVYALVTERFRPFFVGGKTVHQIGIPWHWGYAGLTKGDSANVLTPNVADPNALIPEFKAFLCDVHKKESA
jgi:formate dehydrogenase-N alpha subunit